MRVAKAKRVEAKATPKAASKTAPKTAAGAGAGTGDVRVSPDVHAVRYLNRELSWLEFNRRVLEEAASPTNPLLERLKFLAIFESNLDEFYMVRVSGLIEQFESGVLDTSPDGLTPTEQLLAISHGAEPLRRRATSVYNDQIRPALEKAGITVRACSDLTPKQQTELQGYFEREVFPLCTPLILHPATSVPFISNRSLNLAVELSDGASDVRLARVKIPAGTPRFIRISRRHEYVLLEDLIARNLQYLFPGVEIIGSHLFRVVRDADVEIRELDAADLIAVIEETIRLRRFGDPVLLEHHPGMPPSVRKTLMGLLKLDDEDVFSIDGLLGMEALLELTKIDRPLLRYPPHLPYVAEPLSNYKTIFETISASDVLLHHPYDGFRTIEDFVGSAALDPSVVGIKQTLYRVGSESPIVESLLDAAEAGKQVAVMVELKARFDESNNLGWARALERAGVHVSLGFQDLKMHCKLCLIVRREAGGMHQYVHIGTGNYNPTTARIYTDLGLLSCDPALAQDVSELFNYLTGFSKQTEYRKILVAPLNLREGILDRIRREIKLKKDGRIILKLNALVDPEVIEALYEANAAGAKIDLIVRGMCCLRPGVPGLSENIRVVSIVGRFLEHSRVYYFGNGGKPDVFIGSADCMRRNLDRRIEVLAPVERRALIELIRDRILQPCLEDNVRAWELDGQGNYRRREARKGERRMDCQQWFMAHPATREQLGAPKGIVKIALVPLCRATEVRKLRLQRKGTEMTIRQSLVAQIAVAFAAAIYSLMVRSSLPDVVPIHWNIEGRPDGYGSPTTTLWLMPGVILFMALLTRALPKLSPKQFEISRFERTYGLSMLLVSGLMLGIHFTIVAATRGARIDMTAGMMALMGGFFAVFGLLVGRVRRNFYMGVRTPWTLANEQVWDETHRQAGPLWFYGGLLVLVLALAHVPMAYTLSIFMAVALWPVLNSYLLYRRVAA